jgi:Raf kinase inhibitor-like YbhB/YbcL family protein
MVPASLPRIDFFHWVMVDIPKTITEIPAGQYSTEVVPRGKPGPGTHHGAQHGINDYTAWFSGDAEMKGNYFGYDGPCPPWNDSIWHHYIFTIYALDTPSLGLGSTFDGKTALAALQRHILGSAQITGRYTLNPAVK